MKIKDRLFKYYYMGKLIFLAGAINICAIVLIEFTITHFTGNISKAAIAFSEGEIPDFTNTLSFIALFFLGSVVSGYIYYERKTGLIKYDAIMPILFGIIMCVSFKLCNDNLRILKIISLGMGVQNGTYIKFKGCLVRTTHMTGYLTDAGFCLGSLIRGNTEDIWKTAFYLSSLLLFFIGGVSSFIIIKKIGVEHTIQAIGILYCILGILTARKGRFLQDKDIDVQGEVSFTNK